MTLRPPAGQEPTVMTRIICRDGRAEALHIKTYTIRVSPPGQDPTEREVTAPCVRLGSREGCDVRVDDPTVSRMHAELLAETGGLRVRDLGSRNGTFVDGVRVVEAFVGPRGVLRVGETEIRVVPTGAEAPLPLSTSDRFGDAIGRSAAMRNLFAALERAAASTLTILIEGESGTGKELLAEAVHAQSPRAASPFVVCDCAALAPTLIESELFGHERGAFTGATGRHVGLFEQASRGTLFLDEVGELPLELQTRLLGAIERRRFRRLGGAEIEADVRLVAATNRDLARLVNQGAFREDLYFRLAVVHLRVPPLRERPEDIPALVEHFLLEACGGDGGRAAEARNAIQPEQWAELRAHPWKGNVRALRNFIERTVALAEGWSIEPQGRSSPTTPDPAGSEPEPTSYLDRTFSAAKLECNERFERGYLRAILAREGGNLSKAARAAGVERMHFKRMLRRHGLLNG